MVKIKFCGLYRPEDIEAANQIRPDFIGFILADKGHRKISHAAAARFRAQLDSSIQAVGVFIDEKPEIIADLVTRKIIDCVQLHGHETNSYIQQLQSLLPSPVVVIQAFGVQKPEDIEAALRSKADLLLFDYHDSGSGKTFDWALLKNIDRPFALAGGINIENLDQALDLKPWMIDISSGIETSRLKDPKKMQEIAKRIRGREL